MRWELLGSLDIYVGEGGFAVNCEKTQFFLNTLYDTFTTVILLIRLCIYSNTFLTKNVGVFACSHSVLTDLNFCRVTIRTVQLNHICNLCFVIFVSPSPPPLAVLYANKSKGRRGSRCRCLNSTTWDTVVFSCRVLYL